MEAKTKKIIIALTVLGIAVSAYLTLVKVSHNEFSCNLGQCDVVQGSKYSEIFGIPVAVFGLGYYVLLGALVGLNIKKWSQLWALWGLVFSSYLTILELFVLEAVCGWCVISFAIIILINLFMFKENPNDLSSS